jgi:hypothetical protein
MVEMSEKVRVLWHNSDALAFGEIQDHVVDLNV